MVRAPTAGPSRAASSLAGSVARDIMKKRDKPYKTEYQKVMAKKRKLNLNTSYRDAPEGYTFLPVGTPDLAELCKRLSKERDLPVSVVNTKPTSRMATDPTKLSHHVHRIGYHFHSEVLEQAVAELDYTLHKGQFVKEEDLAKKRQESLTAQILLKHGIRVHDASSSETPQQVRGAIKELFPKIPSDDLDQIVDHAWAEGTGRVGSAQQLDLPRRVQLAVIARIRHKYTDYDQLLRAFEWKEARRMTEAPCLQKLIEWRGEQDVEEEGDHQLEEMVRETIVIEDDDEGDGKNDSDTLANGSEADDEDSTAERGDNSDGSVEVTRHFADDTDIGGESTVESRQPLRRWQQVPRRSQRQQILARQKIAEARMRAAAGPANPYAHHSRLQSRVLTNDSIETVHLSHAPNGGGFSMNGVQYHPVNTAVSAMHGVSAADSPQVQGPQQPPPPPATYAPPRQPQGLYAPPHAPLPVTVSDVTYDPSLRRYAPVQDRPVASIERTENYGATDSGRQAPQYGQVRPRPVTPEQEHSSKRRRIDQQSHRGQYGYGQPFNADVVDLTTPEQPRHRPGVPFLGEVVDLMTPEPPYQPVHPSPLREVKNAPFQYYQPVPQPHYKPVQNAPVHHQPSPMRGSPHRSTGANTSYQDEGDDLAYDPAQPMLQLPQQVDRLSIRPEQYNRPSYSGVPGAWPSSPAQLPSQQPTQPRQYYEVPQQHAYPQAFQPQPTFTYPTLPTVPPPRIVYEQQQPSRPTPQPIHGAPAPVQVIPRYAPHQAYGRPPTVPPPMPPTDGAPAPVQVIPRYAPHSGYG